MRALIDYDNIPDHIRRHGPLNVADKIFEVLRPHLQNESRIDLRLYGGWFEEDKLTRNAQELSVQLAAHFPYLLRYRDGQTTYPVTITASLANSLEVLPKKLLHHTFRMRPPARRILCDDPQHHGCAESPCKLAPTLMFLTNKVCPQAGCSVTPKKILRGTGEQKLVDTMLVADLLHIAASKEPAIAVVTSDDDVWPGLIGALIAGTHVIHLRTRPTPHTTYTDGVPGRYTEISL